MSGLVAVSAVSNALEASLPNLRAIHSEGDEHSTELVGQTDTTQEDASECSVLVKMCIDFMLVKYGLAIP